MGLLILIIIFGSLGLVLIPRCLGSEVPTPVVDITKDIMRVSDVTNDGVYISNLTKDAFTTSLRDASMTVQGKCFNDSLIHVLYDYYDSYYNANEPIDFINIATFWREYNTADVMKNYTNVTNLSEIDFRDEVIRYESFNKLMLIGEGRTTLLMKPVNRAPAFKAGVGGRMW